MKTPEQLVMKEVVFLHPQTHKEAWDAIWRALALALDRNPETWDFQDLDEESGERWQYMGSWREDVDHAWDHQFRHRGGLERLYVKLTLFVCPGHHQEGLKSITRWGERTHCGLEVEVFLSRDRIGAVDTALL
jgi:hypothetical protein